MARAALRHWPAAPRRTTVLLLGLLLGACASALDSPSLIQTVHWPNGNSRERGQLIGGHKEGHWTSWHIYGQKSAEGRYRRDVREGEWRQWFPNGRLRTSAHYRAGRLHGPFRSYRSDGSRDEEGSFHEGLRDGHWTRRYPANKGGVVTEYQGGVEVSRRELAPVAARP
jgi:antitoxin component YwqK of YwqJK toxin-antitoxin module